MKEYIGKYEVMALIGEGGMGTVYRALDHNMGREVALKWLPKYVAGNPEAVKRFEREARLIARLEHPHIVPIYDVGEEEGRPFIVMRLLSGGTLRERIQQTPMTLEALLKGLGQIADALEAAHGMKVVHRDIKPANILFDDPGSAYLTDFGIAKVLDVSATQLTGSGAFIGTPAYMAPEQFTSAELDGRADQYSLAVVAFEALTGRLPFEGNTAQMMFKHVSEAPPDLQEVDRRFPASISAILARALSKKPAERYPTTPGFVADLQEAVAVVPTLGAVQLPKPAPLTPTPSPPPPAPPAEEALAPDVGARLTADYHEGLEAMGRADWQVAIAAFDRVLQVDRYYRSALTLRRQAEQSLEKATGERAAAGNGPPNRDVGAITLKMPESISEEAMGRPQRAGFNPRSLLYIVPLLLAVAAIALAITRPWEENTSTAEGNQPAAATPSGSGATVAAPVDVPLSPVAGVFEQAGPGTEIETDGATEAMSTGGSFTFSEEGIIRAGSEGAILALEDDTRLFLAPGTTLALSLPTTDGQSSAYILLQNGGVVVATASDAAQRPIVANPFRAEARALADDVLMGVLYDETTVALNLDCFRGTCELAGDIEGVVGLEPGARGTVDSDGRARADGHARHEFYVFAAAVATPTATATERTSPTPSTTATATATRTPTATATRLAATQPPATATSPPATQPPPTQPAPTQPPPTQPPPPPPTEPPPPPPTEPPPPPPTEPPPPPPTEPPPPPPTEPPPPPP